MGTRTWVGLAIIMSLWTVNFAVAADWSVVPSVTQRSEFNSNLNMTYTNPISDYLFTLTPAADFNYTSEISQLQGHLGFSGQHYITNSNLDHIDQNYQINGRYQVAPKVNLSLTSAYITDTTMTQELLASGLIMGRTPRQSFAVGPGITYNLTERFLATASYNFNRVLYQSTQYTDYTGHQAGLNFTYLLKNEKTSLISNNIVRETLYAGGNDFKSLGIYLGVSHKFSERWDVSFMSGANISFISSNTQVLDTSRGPFIVNSNGQVVETSQGPFTATSNTKPVQSSNVTPYFNVSTNYRWSTKLLFNATLKVDQNASAYGAVYETNQLFLSCAYNFTERLRGGLSGSYSMSNQTSQTITSRYNYYNLSPSLTYQITEKLSVSPGYNFQNSASLTSTGGSAHNHVGYIQLSYSYPLHYQR
jgi:hypothetical protein